MTERRRFLRFTTALNAICDIVSEKKRSSYRVKNISKEGALLLLDRQLREGSEIKLSMDVPGDNIPILASCQVAWQKPFESDKFETGVRFTRLENLDRSRLLEFIYLQWIKLIEKK